MEQFLEMAEWQQCTAVLYECAVAADSRFLLHIGIQAKAPNLLTFWILEKKKEDMNIQ